MNHGERARLHLEVLRAARAAIDATRPVVHVWDGARLHGTYDRPSAAMAAVEALRAAGKNPRVDHDNGRLARLIDHQPGLSGSSDPGTGEGDPTGNAADRPDQPAHDLRRRDQALRAAYIALDTIRHIDANYGPPRPAGEADRLALRRDNSKAEPCCQNCAGISEAHSDLPYLAAPDPRRQGPTDVGGRLAEPMLLCAWCVNFVAANDRLPRPDELEQHRDRSVVRVRSNPTLRRPA